MPLMTMRRWPLLMAGALVVAGFALAAWRADPKPVLDPLKIERGRVVYVGCSACHNNRKRETLVGPHLVRIIGREAGSVKGYEYSDAMRAAGLHWTPDQLRRFLTDPTTAVPGTNMAINGLPPHDADALVEYLMSRE